MKKSAGFESGVGRASMCFLSIVLFRAKEAQAFWTGFDRPIKRSTSCWFVNSSARSRARREKLLNASHLIACFAKWEYRGSAKFPSGIGYERNGSAYSEKKGYGSLTSHSFPPLWMFLHIWRHVSYSIFSEIDFISSGNRLNKASQMSRHTWRTCASSFPCWKARAVHFARYSNSK